jgi:hypothetical protein
MEEWLRAGGNKKIGRGTIIAPTAQAKKNLNKRANEKMWGW